jgi:hypothetical protein
MAVTFTKIPKLISPSDNPLMYEFSSDQTASPNFTFVYDVYFNGGIVGQGRLVVENGIKAHYDIREWVANLVNPAALSDNITENVLFGRIKLKVTESYGTNPSLMATATSTETNIFKACIDEFRFLDEDFNANYKNFLFLTNKKDRTIAVPSGENVYLSLILNSTETVTIDFKKNGTSLGTFEEEITADILQINANNVLHSFPTATNALIYTSNSEVFDIVFVHDNCAKMNVLRWVNEYGQIDQYFFDHNTQGSATTKALGYSKPFGEWVGGSFTYNKNTGERSHVTQTFKTIELHSGYMNELVQNWLNECVESPRHWVGENTYKLETSSYVNEDERWEDMIAYTVKLSEVRIKKSPKL